MDLVIVGAGLAGCEAAWQAARRGLSVSLVEMKPVHYSAAHVSPNFAELVCSNSLRSNQLGNAVGLLKEEMRRLGKLEARMLATPDQQISMSDPDARSMATSGRGSGMVGYNVQAAVDII